MERFEKEPVLELPAVAKCDRHNGAAGEGRIGRVIGMQIEQNRSVGRISKRINPIGAMYDVDSPGRYYVYLTANIIPTGVTRNPGGC